MDAPVPQCARVGVLMRNSPIYRFLAIGALWLPAAFCLWYALRSPLTWPVTQIVKFVLLHLWPQHFLDVVQGVDAISDSGHVIAPQDSAFQIEVSTNFVFNAAPAGQVPKLAYFGTPAINPLIYGYSIPLFVGLVLATPLEKWRRATQILSGIAVLWLVQAFGVIAETLKWIGISGPPEGAGFVRELGFSLDAVALCYQFGYLILPPLVPAVLWILFNREFIEELTQPARPVPAPAAEPNHAAGVEMRQSGE